MVDLQTYLHKHARTAREQSVGQATKDAWLEPVRKGYDIYHSKRYGQGDYIWDDDWDVCLVLDSCRADLFSEIVDDYPYLPDTVRTKWSVGGASPEWINETFNPEFAEYHKDTAYVTANAFSGKDANDQHRSDKVYPLTEKTELAYLDEAWATMWDAGDKMESIAPKEMTERGFYAYQTQDVDRVVVHYMQPHIPFRENLQWFDGWGGADEFGEPDKHPNKKDAWLKIKDGEIDLDEFWASYRDNLRWVMDEVTKWVERTDATILITSDHGNGTGEFGQWGHCPGSQIRTVRRVPWVKVNGFDVVDYTANPDGDPPATSMDSANEDREEQLEALGYK